MENPPAKPNPIQGWGRFVVSCLKWTFGRWEKEKGRAMTVSAYAVVVFPALAVMADQLPWWSVALPIGFLLVFVAPYAKVQESEEKYEELRRAFDSEKFRKENESYRRDVKGFMGPLHDMYARYSKVGHDEHNLNKVLRGAPHLTPTEWDSNLARFARLVYPATNNPSIKSLWVHSIASRGGVPPLLTLEQYTEFDDLRSQLGNTLGRWEQLSPLCGQWELVVSTLHQPMHENAIKILRYLEEAKGEIDESTSNNPDQIVGWSLIQEWKRQLNSTAPESAKLTNG